MGHARGLQLRAATVLPLARLHVHGSQQVPAAIVAEMQHHPLNGCLLTRERALACLGLESVPELAGVRKAYRQAALRWHPDRRLNHGCEEDAKQRFQEAKEAFDYLQRTLTL